MKLPLPGPAFAATTVAVAGAIALHVRWLPPLLSLAIGGAIGLRSVQRLRHGGRVPWYLRIALVAGLLALVLATVGNVFGREGGSALLSAMLALKLAETETARDARVAVAAACFLALASFLFDQGIVQCALAATVLVLILAALHELACATPAPEFTRVWRPGTLRFALRLMLLAVPFGLVCFYLFPRFSGPLWGAPSDAFAARSGISDRMEPGAISELALDDTPVFRARFLGAVPPPEQRYWRGLVFWNFDGRAWGWPDAIHRFEELEPRVEAAGSPVEYEITLEPTDQRWLFLLDLPLEAPADAVLKNDFQVRATQPVGSVRQYLGRSAVRHRARGVLPRLQRYRGLDLPAGANPRARELADSWIESGLQPTAIVDAALALFNASFIYSLEPPLLAADPIDDFLFDTRTGFCEHFASAFVYLMRSAGVPARVVVGFQGGIWNGLGGYYIVRRSDAHAWAEVWLDGEGWVRVDPTAAVAPERVQASAREAFANDASTFHEGWLGALAQRWDLVGHWWNQAVVQFSALRQRNFMESLGMSRLGLGGMAGMLLAGALAALGLAAWVSRPRNLPIEPVLAAWRLLGARLAAAGVPRRTGEGPVDFAARAAQQLPEDAASIHALSGRFVSLRYAGDADALNASQDFVRAARDFRPQGRWRPPETERRRGASSS